MHMHILRFTLLLLSLQVVIFFLLSAFTDQKSISATFFQIWSNFLHIIRGNPLRPDLIENTQPQIWIYLCLSIFKCFCTATSSKTKQMDSVQVAQFSLVSVMSCFFFFLDLWLSINKGFAGIFFLLPIISFLSMELDFKLLAKCIGFEMVYVFQLTSAVIFAAFLLANKGSYWLLIPYTLIPAFDVIKSLFQLKNAKYETFIYIQHLLPSFLIIAFMQPFDEAYLLFMQAETEVVNTCGIFLIFGLIVVGIEKRINHFRVIRRKEKYFVHPEKCNKEEECSICLDRLTNEKYKDAYAERRPRCQKCRMMATVWTLITGKQEKNVGESRILKTPCGHIFHGACLEKWLENKADCPYCRKELTEFL